MNKLLLGLLIFAVLSVQHVFADDTNPDDWGVATNGVQMSISLKNGGPEIKTNQFVTLLVRFRNLSTNETIRLYRGVREENRSYGGVSCQVMSPSGKDILPNIDNTLGFGSGADYPVSSNQIYEFEFDLGNFCRFNEVGTYKIIATKILIIGHNKMFPIVSNPLNVSVVPAK